MTTDSKKPYVSTADGREMHDTRSVIEQILYYETLTPEVLEAEAGNDNVKLRPAKKANASNGPDTFSSWALPEFMR
jgi:hypothetical protein